MTLVVETNYHSHFCICSPAFGLRNNSAPTRSRCTLKFSHERQQCADSAASRFRISHFETVSPCAFRSTAFAAPHNAERARLRADAHRERRADGRRDQRDHQKFHVAFRCECGGGACVEYRPRSKLGTSKTSDHMTGTPTKWSARSFQTSRQRFGQRTQQRASPLKSAAACARLKDTWAGSANGLAMLLRRSLAKF